MLPGKKMHGMQMEEAERFSGDDLLRRIRHGGRPGQETCEGMEEVVG